MADVNDCSEEVNNAAQHFVFVLPSKQMKMKKRQCTSTAETKGKLCLSLSAQAVLASKLEKVPPK